MDSSNVVELRSEIDRLARELDQASSEKIQSAKYGLGLLEEKCMLQHKCEELETLYENAKHDLEITQEVSVFHASFVCFFQFFIRQSCIIAHITPLYTLIFPKWHLNQIRAIQINWLAF